MKHRLLLILLAASLVMGSILLPTSAATKEDLIIHDCDTGAGFTGGLKVDNTTFTQGTGSLTADIVPSRTSSFSYRTVLASPIYAFGYNTLAFDLYVSDPELFKHVPAIIVELSSSGMPDVEECEWTLSDPLVQGWNTIQLPVQKHTVSMVHINYFRIYANGIEAYTSTPVTIKIDNIRATATDLEPDGATVKGQQIGSLKEVSSGNKPENAVPDLTPITVPGTETYHNTVFMTFAIVGFSLAGAALIAMVIFFIVKTKKKILLRVLTLCLTLVFAGCGVACFLLYQVEHEREVLVPIPQMSMEEVEELLKVDPNYDTKEDYKVKFEKPENDESNDKDDENKEEEADKDKWKFRQPTLIESDLIPDQYVVAVTTPQAFGAKADGVTDCSVFLRQAINYVNQRGGGVVFLPAGRYRLAINGINIPRGVTLVGELEPGTTNGTVLELYGGKGNAKGSATFVMEFQSGIKNVAFWYPEQEFVNGSPIPYPPTIMQSGADGITVENVNFVNSYYAINLSNGGNALQAIRNIYGSPLYKGIENDYSLDIGRFENINFSPKYWLLSGFENVPAQQLLTTWMLRNSVGIRIGRVDWTYYDKINIEGYKIGIDFYISANGGCNGHLLKANITDCYYPVYTHNTWFLNLTDCTLSATGNEGAAAIYVPKGASMSLNLSQCKISSTGKNAIYNPQPTHLTFVNCEVSSVGTPFVTTASSLYTAVNTTFNGENSDKYQVQTVDVPLIPDVDYDRVVVTKPKSTALVDLSKAPYSIKIGDDISDKLQQALDSLKETGGTVYLPGGDYYVTKPITVWEGIELTGVQDNPHCYAKSVIRTNYGEGQANAAALITLKSGSGVRGIDFIYHELPKHGSNVPPYAYTIRGDGAGVYVINCAMPIVYNGIDFATNRCDNHYIEYVWGCAINNAVWVGGGSENGIVRDCHYTQNTAWIANGDQGYLNTVRPLLTTKSVTFRIGQTKNQILYNTFVWGAYKGVEVMDGAENCVIVSHGTDWGNHAVYLSGNSTVTMIDPQLVAAEGSVKNYITADQTFTGQLNVYNGACWGGPSDSVVLRGDADYNFYQIYFDQPGTRLFTISDGSLEVVGLTRLRAVTLDVVASENVESVKVSASVALQKLKTSIADGVKVEGSDLKK